MCGGGGLVCVCVYMYIYTYIHTHTGWGGALESPSDITAAERLLENCVVFRIVSVGFFIS